MDTDADRRIHPLAFSRPDFDLERAVLGAWTNASFTVVELPAEVALLTWSGRRWPTAISFILDRLVAAISAKGTVVEEDDGRHCQPRGGHYVSLMCGPSARVRKHEICATISYLEEG